MQNLVRASILDREGLVRGLANFDACAPAQCAPVDLVEHGIPAGGGILVSWDVAACDPLADLLIVNDNEVADTLAWIGSYFSQFIPVTQWCRVVSQHDARRLVAHSQAPTLKDALPLWVGLVLAECSVQAGYNINLKELPASATLTSATFAAARAVALFGSGAPLKELASKHHDLAIRLREGGRPISASRLLPLWYCMCEQEDWAGTQSERKALEPVLKLLKTLRTDGDGKDGIASKLSLIADEFDLPELLACSRGPQFERVGALDALIRRMSAGPVSSAIEAVVGLGASMIDPGATVLPGLLRSHGSSMQMAPIWLGMFAGAWDRFRVLTDHQGLGRLIAKALLASDDIRRKPSCDIAFDELSRWIGSAASSKVPVRGMAARSLVVELLPGVTCTFAAGRSDSARADNSAPMNAQDRHTNDTPRVLSETGGAPPQRRQVNFDSRHILETLELLKNRITRLEALASERIDLFGGDTDNRGRKRGYNKPR